MREYAPYAVRGEVTVVSELLEAQHIHALLLHVPGYLLAGITGNLTSEVMYVVGGYLQILSCRGLVFRQVELEDRRQISPVAENATSGTSAQRLRANAQQSDVIRLAIRSTGIASPSNGMMTESTGATLPEKAATMVMVAKTNVAAIRQM